MPTTTTPLFRLLHTYTNIDIEKKKITFLFVLNKAWSSSSRHICSTRADEVLVYLIIFEMFVTYDTEMIRKFIVLFYLNFSNAAYNHVDIKIIIGSVILLSASVYLT